MKIASKIRMAMVAVATVLSTLAITATNSTAHAELEKNSWGAAASYSYDDIRPLIKLGVNPYLWALDMSEKEGEATYKRNVHDDYEIEHEIDYDYSSVAWMAPDENGQYLSYLSEGLLEALFDTYGVFKCKEFIGSTCEITGRYKAFMRDGSIKFFDNFNHWFEYDGKLYYLPGFETFNLIYGELPEGLDYTKKTKVDKSNKGEEYEDLYCAQVALPYQNRMIHEGAKGKLLYYAKNDGSIAQSEWIHGEWLVKRSAPKKVNGNTYYAQSLCYGNNLLDGYTGAWLREKYADKLESGEYTSVEGWSYANADGTLATGWKQIDGDWYYFDWYETPGYIADYTADKVKEYADFIEKVNGIEEFMAMSDEYKEHIYEIHSEENAIKDAAEECSTYCNTYARIKLPVAVTNRAMEINGKTYVFGEDGKMLSGTTATVGGVTYTIGKSGAVTSATNCDGWANDRSGAWCYYRGGEKATGWAKVGKSWYLFNGSGAMQTGWAKSGGKWYYLKESGAMATGWQKVGSEWYYLGSNGAMVTGWLKSGSTWYYLKPSGAMATGWVKYGKAWYYFKQSGAMATGWLKDGGSWYYLGSGGAMVANSTVKVGGKSYTFNKSGVWVK